MSIRERAWFTKKGEARKKWIVSYTDQTGARRIATFARKRDADIYQAEVKIQVRAGTFTPPSVSPTIAEAGRLWITTGEKNRLERSTLTMYRQQLSLHIAPYLGGVKLSQLSAPMVREFEDQLARDGRSAAMVRKVRVSLSSLISDALERGLVSHNVVRELRARRRPGRERKAERRQRGKLKVGVDIPTREEIKAVVDHLDGRWRPIILTAIFSGLRASELRALRWIDVDFAKQELHVKQRADRYLVIGAPKSEAGERAVPLPPIVVNVLREWKLACPKTELDLVFPSKFRRVEHHATLVRRGLAPAMIRAGVTVNGRAKYTGLHCLRHFYASWCINRRVDGGLELPLKVVQARLGHASVTLTADCYGHLFPRGDDHAELAAAERALLGPHTI